MKKLLPAILALLLCACGASDATTAYTASEISGSILNETELWEGELLDADSLYTLYGIEPELYTEAAVFQAPNGIFPHEGFVIAAKDAASAREIETLLESYRQSLMSQAKDYDPESYAVMEQCRVNVRGVYVSLFLSPLRETMEGIYDSAFSEAGLPEPKTAPSPEPSPEPTPEPTPPGGLLEKSERVSDSWFDDCLLVGDSVANNLAGYIRKCRGKESPECFGKGVLFTAGNFSYHLAVQENRPVLYFPIYEGRPQTVEHMVATILPGKIMFNMGMNDIALVGIDQTMENVDTLMRRCLEEKPDLTIILMGMTPRIGGTDRSNLSNALICEFNDRLCAYCEENEFWYLDSYEALANEKGELSWEHCSDPDGMGLHPNYAGCEVWLDYIYEHCGEIQ